MSGVKVRLLYRNGGDHLGYRNASEYVPDPRDLDKDGNPPNSFMRQESIALEAGEVEFDHEPTEAELRAAFPDYKGTVP